MAIIPSVLWSIEQFAIATLLTLDTNARIPKSVIPYTTAFVMVADVPGRVSIPSCPPTTVTASIAAAAPPSTVMPVVPVIPEILTKSMVDALAFIAMPVSENDDTEAKLILLPAASVSATRESVTIRL